MLRHSKRVLADLVSVLQAVADTLEFPTQTAANTKFVRRPITLTGCVYVIFNAGNRKRVDGMRPTVVGRTMPWSHERLHSLAEYAAAAIV